VIKASLTVVSFGGPLLLGQLVRYVEKGDDDKNIGVGLGWCSLFFIGYCIIATLNTQYNIRGMVLALRMKGALTRILFSRAISLPSCAWADLQFTDSQLITLIQVDVEKVSDTFKCLHDLWILPLQVLITFVLLYQEVDVAFLAGVAIIIIMIPLNTIIAKKIGIASKELMTHKGIIDHHYHHHYHHHHHHRHHHHHHHHHR
jgi:ATP-binding cassette subfamily C (CFTR/MRP) protein 10